MSIKGNGKTLFVRKSCISVMGLLGNTKDFHYDNIKTINYHYAENGKAGYLKISTNTGTEGAFKFSENVNDKISQTILYLKSHFNITISEDSFSNYANKIPDEKNRKKQEALIEYSIGTEKKAATTTTENNLTIYFKNGTLYQTHPSNAENWYDARYLVSDGVKYDLEKVEDLRKIPIPNFPKCTNVMAGYGVTGSLDYVLRMKAGNLYARREKDLCSACLWKSTEMMLANEGIGWKKDDYFRIVYWHNDLGMFEEAKKAKEYLLTFDVCVKNHFDIYAKKIRDIVLEKSQSFGTDLIAFNDFGGGCCSECAKMRGRVYSISGKSKVFPKLPEYVLENGNFHPGCRCMMSLFFENETELFYKGERANAKALSRRPWVDDRDEKERQLYKEYLNNIQKDIAHIKKREEYSIKKGMAQREFDQILMYLPELAPKSITGYMRMKTSKSKNFIKLFNAAKEKGIDIKTD